MQSRTRVLIWSRAGGMMVDLFSGSGDWLPGASKLLERSLPTCRPQSATAAPVVEHHVDGDHRVLRRTHPHRPRFRDSPTWRAARRGQETMRKLGESSYPQVLTVPPRGVTTAGRLLTLVQQPVEAVGGRSETATTWEVVAVRNDGGRLMYWTRCAGSALKERDCEIGHRRSGSGSRRCLRPHT